MKHLSIRTFKALPVVAILIAITIMLAFALNRPHAQAQEYYVSPLNQGVSLYASEEETYYNMSDISQNDLKDVKYISNSAYFIANPKHAQHNDDYNSQGTCTTVAMQMLLGYHNYYSDRRLIPKFGDNNRQFLSNDYGDILGNPIFLQDPADGYGLSSIGTEDGVYDEIFDLTTWGSFPALGQAVGPVTRAAEDFVEKYSGTNSVTLSSSWFSDDDAKDDINDNKPIILGMSMLINGANSYHVMVAYGYATVKGEPGYIVHCGWSKNRACTWVPTKYFEYQIRMKVEHTHNLIDTGININEPYKYRCINYRELECAECGYTTYDDLYDTDELGYIITTARYPLSGELIIPSTIHDNTITTIGNGAFSGSNITGLKLQDNISIIGDSAFENCSSLTNVSSYYSSNFSHVTSIGNYAFRGCNLQDIDLSMRLETIGVGAFAGCDKANISVDTYNQNYYAQDNILYNKSQTTILQAFSIPHEITIPNNITNIAPFAFEENSNIDTVYINGNPIIGNYAFANCVNLGNVYFDSYTASIAGIDVFKGKVPTIIVPYNAQNAFKRSFSQYSDSITSEQFAVDFICNGQVIESRRVYNGSTIQNLPTPTLIGHDFGDWYDNPNYTGTPYKNGGLWESDTTITLYANMPAQDCTIIFDPNGGTISGNNSITVKYGSTFTTSITAQKEGHYLDGWYDNNKVKYVTADGRSTRQWDKPGITTLEAKWSPESYEIRINNDGTITWLSNNGLSNYKSYMQYGTALSYLSLISAFRKATGNGIEGMMAIRFKYNDLIVSWENIPDLGENNSVITLVPEWMREVHTIFLYTDSKTISGSIVGAYGSNISFPTPTRIGYTFDGWFTEIDGGTKATWATMPDITPEKQSDGKINLYAHWTAITYHVYYKANGGSGTMNYTTHTYGVSFNLPTNKFTKTGHDFSGWATTANGSVVYTDGQGVQDLAEEQGASITLYAKWTAKRYTITYKNLTPDMVASPTYYTYGIGMSVIPAPRFRSQYGEETELERFDGWYTSSAFTTQVTSISKTRTGNITLYAKYDYRISTTSISGTYTITDSGTDSNPSINVTLNLGKTYYNKVKNTTLNKIRIEFSFDLWEVDDGYQHIYIRDNNTKSIIWSVKIDHSGGKKTYTYSVEVDLEKYKNTDSITFLFDASGAFSDTWKFEDFNARVYLTN